MSSRQHSLRTFRTISALLAVAWLAGGCAAIVAAFIERQWMIAVAGVCAIWYGFVWIVVCRQGRRLTGQEALMPWRVGRHENTRS